MNAFRDLAIAASIAAMGGTAAHAALLDFTNNDVGLSGMIAGATYSVTGFPVAPNHNQAFDGNASDVVGVGLALDNDGLGIRDDEIAFGRQYVDVTFGRAVTITSLYFLDLFANPADSSDRERAYVSVDGGDPVLFKDGEMAKAGNNSGFADRYGTIRGSLFRFTAGPGNDGYANPDFALAAIEVAPIPVPAAGLLLIGGLGAFGLMKRKRRAA